MGKFHQISTLIYVKISFPGSILSRFPGSYLEHLLTNFRQTLYRSSYQEVGLKIGKFPQISTEL